MSKSSIGTEPVYDARTLGKPRMFILGLQHMFAMFGATVLVPTLSGLDVATTLLFAGIGTLLFHLLTKGKVPAFLGSSFAFIGGYNAVRTIGTNPDGSAIYNNDLLAYACFGVAIAGLMYIILSTLFKVFGVKKVMRYFPPIVTGPIIISIGLTLSSSAITNCRANWLVAVVAILIVIGFNMWGKGMAKIIPILLGVLGSYIFALIVDPAERASVAAAVSSAKWFGLPIFWKNSVFHLFAGPVDSGVLWSAVLTVVPLSLATMVEHIGDICAISSTCGKNFMVDPGFQPMPEMSAVPLVGSIACGTPILAEQNIEARIGVPALWQADFALTCHGNSMAAMIQDGDIVCIRKQPEVENGEIAAVRIGEEATLKRFYRQGDTVMLQAENPAFSPLVYTRDQLNEITIEGRVVGICRGI